MFCPGNSLHTDKKVILKTGQNDIFQTWANTVLCVDHGFFADQNNFVGDQMQVNYHTMCFIRLSCSAHCKI